MEISEIKQKLPISHVLDHYNHQPDRNNMLRCPFHDDKTASLKIYTSTNSFHCFGCGKSGDQVEFCSLKEGSKHKGILKAKSLAGSTANEKKSQAPLQSKHPLPEKENTEILTKIFSSFRSGLKSPISKRPKEYLEERNLDYNKLEIGYNSGQFHHRGKLDKADTKACVDAGLLIPYDRAVPNATGTTYTAFAKDCIIFPLKNRQNQVVSLYGRSIQSSQSAQSAQSTQSGKHFYLKNRCGLYPHYPDPNTKTLIGMGV